MKPPTIIVDNHAADSAIARQLREKDAHVIASHLKGGQYRVTDQCVIWHLTAEEFNGLVADRSIYRRIPEFKRAAAEPILLIEGDPMDHLDRVKPGTLRGALAFVTMHNRVPILAAADEREVTELIFIMANQGQNGMGLTNNETIPAFEGGESPQDNGEPANGKNGGHERPTDPAELQEYILRTIPNVTPAAARAMLKKFGSLRAICAASARDLSPLEGIGPGRAKKIAGFLSGMRD